MFKEYDISFYGKRYKEKPTGKEIGEISRKLTANRLSYDFIAKRVGENGCVFDPIPAPGCAFCETAGRAKCEGLAPVGRCGGTGSSTLCQSHQ